jgi:hypothetical protein
LAGNLVDLGIDAVIGGFSLGVFLQLRALTRAIYRLDRRIRELELIGKREHEC